MNDLSADKLRCSQDGVSSGSHASCPVAPPPSAPQLGEDAFRRVVEWSPSAMVMVNREGTMVLANAQTELMFGHERATLIGQPVEILVPERFRSHHSLYRAGYFGDPKPRPMGAGRDLVGRRADGSEFPIEIGLNPINTDNGIGLPPEMDMASLSSLGLQLVPLFVEQLHGTLVIERVAGTRFSIRFPKTFAPKEVV